MEKQFGVYQGDLTEDGLRVVEKGNEQEMYTLINGLSYRIFKMEKDLKENQVLESKYEKYLEELKYALEYAILRTRRFGVIILDAEKNCHIERTDSYEQWFNWWHEYFQKTLTDDEWNEFNKRSIDGNDISHFRPEGDWKNI